MFIRFSSLVVVASLAATAPAQADQSAHLAKALKEADQVVVGQVSAVDAAWKVNAHGDQLIVSRAWIRTEESLKGNAASDVPVEIEGGTVGDVTLKVSDMPTLKRGDRAVFILKRTPNGDMVPYGRGAGVLHVSPDGAVRAAGMPLDKVRQLARQSR